MAKQTKQNVLWPLVVIIWLVALSSVIVLFDQIRLLRQASGLTHGAQTPLDLRSYVWSASTTTLDTSASGQARQQPTRRAALVTQRDISQRGKTWSFRHYCQGLLLQRWGAKACLGRNQLWVRLPAGTYELIDDRLTTTVESSPVFISVEQLRQRLNKDHLLISYASAACTLATEACLGVTQRAINFDFNLSDDAVHALSSFPTRGKLVWNDLGTRAIVVFFDGCEGACQTSPLGLYDLQKDVVSILTTQKAFDGMTQSNDVYPYWKDVRWLRLHTVGATLVTGAQAQQVMRIKLK